MMKLYSNHQNDTGYNLALVSLVQTGGRPRTEPDGRRHGDLRGARLEPHEGPAGHGPRAPHRPEEGRQRVPPHHQGHARGEDHGVCLLTAISS